MAGPTTCGAAVRDVMLPGVDGGADEDATARRRADS